MTDWDAHYRAADRARGVLREAGVVGVGASLTVMAAVDLALRPTRLYPGWFDRTGQEWPVPIGSRAFDLTIPTRGRTLAVGTRLVLRATRPDNADGLDAELYEILDGPHAGSWAVAGIGSRYGINAWIAADLLIAPDFDRTELPSDLADRVARSLAADSAEIDLERGDQDGGDRLVRILRRLAR